MKAAGVATKTLWAMCLAGVLSIAAAALESHAQTTPAPSPIPPATPVATPLAIPSAEVIAKSSEVTNLLAALSEKFAPSPEIQKIAQSLPEVTEQIKKLFVQ